jgi:NAD-dependent dihydropyrimidine dehydrogenase PreA subunit
VFKVTRDVDLCTGCEGCRQACPARLPVHRVRRVSSVECTSCQDCVVACPVRGCLTVRPPAALPVRTRLRPLAPVLLAVVLYLGVVTGFRIAGYWHTEITEAEYHRRLPEIESPVYTHPR